MARSFNHFGKRGQSSLTEIRGNLLFRNSLLQNLKSRVGLKQCFHWLATLGCLISLRGGYLSCATLFVGAGIDFMSCIAGSDVFVRCILQILLHCRICNWWPLKNGDFHVDSVM